MNVFKSGAFLQQCFSVHPLTLKLKLVTPPSLVGIVCTNCRMKHRLTVRTVVLQGVEKEDAQDVRMVSFQQCSETHPEEVRISSVDVVKDTVEFRCYPCRRTYVLEIGMIETHQS
ncbi:MAG: hypothetical protein WD032_09075 [Nitrospirales bacterium]